MKNQEVHIKVVGPEYGDRNLVYNPVATQSEQYQIAREEVMTKIAKGYRLLEAQEGHEVKLGEDGALPEAGEYVLLMPLSGG